MKRYLIAVLMFAVLGAMAYAGVVPANSELGLSGQYVKEKGGDATYLFEGQVAAPILDQKGRFLLGPKVRYSSDEALNAAGVVAEVNLNGSRKSGFYFGANGLYDLKAVEGVERYTVDGVAGVKIALGKGGSGFKVFVSKPVAGRGKDDTDLYANVGLLVRF